MIPGIVYFPEPAIPCYSKKKTEYTDWEFAKNEGTTGRDEGGVGGSLVPRDQER